MKKFNSIFLIALFALSLFMCSCSASGGISVGKQQNAKIEKSVK